MNETRNSRGEVFQYLANTGCLVKMSTAAVIKGVVHRDYVVVHEAPPRVIRELVNNFVMVDLGPEGLLIPLATDDSDSLRTCGCGAVGIHGVDHED